MTLTRHGHHIAGTPATDEDANALRARCGGPGLCRGCSAEAAVAVNKLHDETKTPKSGRVAMSAVISGGAYPTAEDLIEQLSEVPHDARVMIVGGIDSRERTPYWSLTCQWGGETETHDVRIRGFGRQSSGDRGIQIPSPLTSSQFEHPAHFGVD